MKALKKEGFSYQDVISFGNMFLLGNGRYGYRGTLEEFRAKEMVGLNVLGFYDRFGDKWREPINLPNPFYVLVSTENGERSLLKKEALHHEIILDLENALFQRKTEFEDIDIISKRLLSQSDKDDLFCSYSIKAKQDTTI
ncbi:MAG: glycoside hydrolase family 65 protein, partial [Bacilli bacterium]|nr:glycoside hydrolase family 65 protein [Bacilli bacterium]